MDVAALIVEELEEELRNWILKSHNLRALYEALPQLYQKLTSQNINGVIEEGASIVGSVHVGANSVIQAGSAIVGPVIIAENVVVGTGVELREYTYIGSGTHISHGATIERSLVLNSSILGAGIYISNAIIGANVQLGPHAIIGAEVISRQIEYTLATFTAVGAKARIGAAVVIERGVAVADRASVDNGVVLSTDVPPAGFIGRAR